MNQTFSKEDRLKIHAIVKELLAKERKHKNRKITDEAINKAIKKFLEPLLMLSGKQIEEAEKELNKVSQHAERRVSPEYDLFTGKDHLDYLKGLGKQKPIWWRQLSEERCASIVAATRDQLARQGESLEADHVEKAASDNWNRSVRQSRKELDSQIKVFNTLLTETRDKGGRPVDDPHWRLLCYRLFAFLKSLGINPETRKLFLGTGDKGTGAGIAELAFQLHYGTNGSNFNKQSLQRQLTRYIKKQQEAGKKFR